jgi:hypothetical protein
MTSPDFRDYIDLTIYDTTPQILYDDSVTYAQTAMPEFDPRIGTIEDALLQGMAFVGAILATGINRLPNGLMEGILTLLGFARKEAQFATGTATITTSINTGTVIPQGTVFTYDVFEDGITTSYPFETDSDLVIASTFDEGEVAITATNAGQYPALLAGQALTLVSQVPYVIAVELTGDIEVGADTETQTQFFNRGARYLASLNATIATSTQMTNYIGANYTTVPVFKVYDLVNSTDMLFATADAPGYVTVAVCNTDGGALTSTVKNDLLADLDDRCVAGLTITVVDILNFTVQVNVSVSVLDGFTPSTVTDEVAAVLDKYLTYSGWDFAETINKNILIAKASQVPGVRYISSLAIVITGSTTYAEMEEVAAVETGNVTILRAGVVPVGTAEVSAI